MSGAPSPVAGQEGARPRAHTVAFVGLPPNRLIWAALIVLVLVQWAAVAWPPLAGLLRTVPLGPGDWLLVAAAVLWPIGLLEATKRPRRQESEAQSPHVGRPRA